MPDRICYIVGAGEIYGLDFTVRPEDCVIAADGGLNHLARAGIAADLIIGDFDTLGHKPDRPNVIALPAEKDETDTLAAMREGIRRGYRTFRIYAGTGGRFAHTYANIQLLAYLAENGMRGYLFDRDAVMTALTDDTMQFGAGAEGSISVFSLSEKSCGVFLNNLKYPLTDATVTHTFPIGVSNAFTGMKSTVTVKNGTLLVIFPRNTMCDLIDK